MRNKISGTIGIVWGGGILVGGFLSGAGVNTAGLVFSFTMLGLGIYYLTKAD